MSEKFATPMLAAKPKQAADYGKITYPKLGSPKLDGVRAVVRGARLWSRKGILIPNKRTQKMLGKKAYEGFDGELIAGNPVDKNAFQNTMKVVTAVDVLDPVTYYVFDFLRGNVAGYAYKARWDALQQHLSEQDVAVRLLEQVLLNSAAEAERYEADCLLRGYEGIMLRDPAGAHKAGRSTLREQGLIAIKRFVEFEFEITGFEEQMHNANEATRDALGRTKRSSTKAGKIPAGLLGSFQGIVVACSEAPEIVGTVCNVGTGLNADQRLLWWRHRDAMVGLRATGTFQNHGIVEKTRIAVFKGLRDAAY